MQDSDHSIDFHESAETGTPNETPVQPSLTISEGRRRGRRKVMKKKTLKDEEGYLGMWTPLRYVNLTFDTYRDMQ